MSKFNRKLPRVGYSGATTPSFKAENRRICLTNSAAAPKGLGPVWSWQSSRAQVGGLYVSTPTDTLGRKQFQQMPTEEGKEKNH